MRRCPWCGHENLNVYAYCLSCGRGFSGPDAKPVAAQKPRRRLWPFRSKAA